MSTQTPVSSTNFVRVTISIPELNVDVPIASNIPVDHVIADLLPFLRQELENQGYPTSYIDQPNVKWKLTLFGNKRLIPTRSLTEQAVTHGDRIYLEIEKTAEQFPALIDDVAESVIEIQSKKFPAWDVITSIRAGVYSLIGFAILSSLAIIKFCLANRSSGINLYSHKDFIASVILIIFGIFTLFAGLVVNRKSKTDDTYPDIVSQGLILVGLLWVTTGTFTIINRPLAVGQIILAASVLFALSCTSAQITKSFPVIHITLITTSLMILVFAVFHMLVNQSVQILGCEIIAIALILIFSTTSLSLKLAKITLPPVPAPGEDHIKDYAAISVVENKSVELSKIDGYIPDEAIEQERRATNQYWYTVGLILSSCIVILIGAYFAANWYADHRYYTIVYLVIIALLLVLRGKSYADKINRIILIASSTLLITIMFINYTVNSPESGYFVFGAFAFISIVIAGSLVIAVQQRTFATPVQRKTFEVIEWMLYATVIPLLVMITNLFFTARNHS